ncbi:unnamed protein product [Parnassius mnemosyne]|uniref:Ciliogenesis-associated TTC17-interacting protein N-terminal domain-containing protein n=1 Tax=Parnassius mnemosyne TaxID=213953 RepID=A0AAV1M3K8_9NEOP
MSFGSNISLIDLSKQIPFEIDDTLKKQLCFGESLIISCGHVDGNLDEIFSDSECSSTDSSHIEEHENVEDKEAFDVKTVKKQVDENIIEENVDDDDNFYFYFFPDCEKPIQSGSSQNSLIIKDGMPKINPTKQNTKYCTCELDKNGQCKCFHKIPCLCGPKEISECTCSKLDGVCICNDTKPTPICTCNEAEICMCDPDGKPRVVCTCDEISETCICHTNKDLALNCNCKHKIKSVLTSEIHQEIESGRINVLENFNKEKAKLDYDRIPCECQKSEKQVLCQCLKGKNCTCKPDVCVCEQENILCMCEAINEEVERDNVNLKPPCNCPNPEECTCDSNLEIICRCFPTNKVCSCENPENCKCFHTCQCLDPCVCDTEVDNYNECTCFTESTEMNQKGKGVEKLKKVRAGKHGFRWCHDVNPRHTYFGYGYGRHDKINYKEKEKEKIEILGKNKEKIVKKVSDAEHLKTPIYQKKARKLSIDCCSAVGGYYCDFKIRFYSICFIFDFNMLYSLVGLTINVETLGEDKDKFLVQVVSHSSKEGAKTGTKIVSIIDCNLHTLEENRSEYIQKRDKFKEKRNYMAICESGYYNKVTHICGDRHLIKRFYHTFEEAHNFLLEGANIVLMRYVGLTRYKGCIKTDTVLIDGVVCESIFVCLGVSQAIVNGQPLFVEKVERHIIEPSGCIHQSLSVMTLKGYVVSQEWADNSYIIHINPLLRVSPEENEIEPHAPLRESWRKDLQLLSDYLDFKASRSSEGARYVSENGELTGTIRDYLQTVLLLRPNDVLHFTRHYFGAALSALDLPHNEFFDSSAKHVRYFYFEE